jgi:hypothetical protein
MRDADPVFVDRSGRRRQLFAAAGFAGGTALLVATGALLAGFTGVGTAHVPALPGTGQTPEVVLQPMPAGPTPTHTRRPSPTPTKPAASPSGSSSPSTSPSPTSRRNVPTHTPSNPHKKK